MANNAHTTSMQEKTIECTNWIDLFRLSINKTMELIHCATLAYYVPDTLEWFGDLHYGTAEFKPIPLTTEQQEYKITAYFLNEPEKDEMQNLKQFETDKIYCIIFMDNNFLSCLKSGNIVKTKDTDTHSLSYGIVISTL